MIPFLRNLRQKVICSDKKQISVRPGLGDMVLTTKNPEVMEIFTYLGAYIVRIYESRHFK